MDFVRVLINGDDEIVISQTDEKEIYQINMRPDFKIGLSLFLRRDELVELKAKIEVLLDFTVK